MRLFTKLLFPVAAADQDIHLYLHVQGEPLDKALTLDLSTKGK